MTNRDRILAEYAAGNTACGAARKLGISRSTVRHHWPKEPSGAANSPTHSPANSPRLPDPAPEAGGPGLPEPAAISYDPYRIDTPGAWGVISDVHLPFHDLGTIRGWVDECKRRGVTGLLLNGDILDCFSVSDHYREPTGPRMKEEVEKGRQLIEYLRSTFPRARICYKFGNHDERYRRFLANRAAELFDLEDIHLPALLRLDAAGVEVVQEKRVVMVGKLPVIHGHEYQGGGGVMPARWLFLRTGESALTAHFHQPTYYTFRTITGKEVGMWSMGCACHLSPAYRPLNQWGNGWAVIDVANDLSYHVHNRRLLRNGQVV